MYVDDFKMAGEAQAVKDMWIRLKKRMELDTPVPLTESVYLGCYQHEFVPPDQAVADKSVLFDRLFHRKEGSSQSFSDTESTRCTERGGMRLRAKRVQKAQNDKCHL